MFCRTNEEPTRTKQNISERKEVQSGQDRLACLSG